ncbi:hypothetical protein [Solemya velum gill symbiont]|uniref:hypothetical protein n=1 Tax=Solemya velum gill symbiont TaxID=2340 RepID=UPI00117BADC4|nr:hypothetical protein [Solemya velum gill symbiont]
MKRFLTIFIIPVLMLTGCTTVVTKENAASFDTWELCTLLYDPNSLYSDWISMEEEDSAIRAELEKRGFSSEADCSIQSVAKRKCDNYGFKPGTTEHTQCRLDVEHHIKEMKQMKKSAHDAEQSDAAIQVQQQQIIQQQQQSLMRPWWSW